MTTSEGQWTQAPTGWAPVPEEVFEHARAQVLVALDSGGERPVGPRLASYYDRDGNYAGAAFAELLPNDPHDLTATDLHAVSLLSVTVGPGATRRFLDSGPVRSALLAKLADVPEVDLHVAGPDDLLAMAAFYEEVKMHLAEPTTVSSDRWVTASKICARKRPSLFPVRDRVIRDLLGLTRHANYQVDWQVFRALIGDRDIINACDAARTAAHEAADGRRVDIDQERLRVLDAALWTYPPKGRRP